MRSLEKKFTCDNKVTRMKGSIGGSLFEAALLQIIKYIFRMFPVKSFFVVITQVLLHF